MTEGQQTHEAAADETHVERSGWRWVDEHPGRLPHALDRLPLRLAYVDRHGIGRYRNRAMQEWLGRDVTDRAELPVSALLGEAQWEAVERRMAAALAGVPQVFERPGIGDPGSGYREETAYLPVVGPDGPDGIMVVVGDATRRASGESMRSSALIRSALLEERNALAVLMHDDVLQGLFSVALDLDLLADLPPAAKQRVEGAQETLRAAIERLRWSIERISRGGGRSSPVSGVEQLVHATVAHAGIRASVAHHGSFDDVPERFTEQLLTVVAEALKNVVAHSGATVVSVTLARQGEDLVLTVVDDGVGVELARASAAGGADHAGRIARLRRETEAYGGELSTTDAEPRGTTLTWRMPLD
ncbi:MAG: PAS domain-containing protein [Nocardioidaceae bacterium]|nr:PAS domain-containing protein [Nocardioidaceae bacterium]